MNQKILIASLCLLALSACSSGNPKFGEVLDKIDTLLADYEKLANKEPLCISDMNTFTVKNLPLLTQLKKDAEEIKNSDKKPSDTQLKRYGELSTKFQAAALKLNQKSTSVKVDC